MSVCISIIIVIIKAYSHLTSFEVIGDWVRSIRFHSTGLIVAVYQSLHTREQFFRSSVLRNLNIGTSVEHRFRKSLSCSSEFNFGTGLITYLGMWLHFFELDSTSSMGRSELLAIGSMVRISSLIFTLPDTEAVNSCEIAILVSGMYSDYKHTSTSK